MDSDTIRVLIAEDDGFQRLAVVDIFENLDYEVTGAENGQAAWNCLEESTIGYTFAVIDMIMPEVDGLELIHKIKNSTNPLIKNLPVFMMSSNEEVEMVTSCL
ncbi:MAG: response regulator [Kangiellaceae bacterium]|jgi:CheY-like chemotaxis protein|nr:response regulator [Kangiellaceae bacterium]